LKVFRRDVYLTKREVDCVCKVTGWSYLVRTAEYTFRLLP